MEKLPVVETAKALMTEAVAWSVMKWLREKKAVRKAADEANAALDHLNLTVKNRWPVDVRIAYEMLAAQAVGNYNAHSRREAKLPAIDPKTITNAKRIREVDEEARRARMDAEGAFDIAEKQLSTALAREGCRKAIYSWELHERAIRKAEELISSP